MYNYDIRAWGRDFNSQQEYLYHSQISNYELVYEFVNRLISNK